jgi:hypothetical protein
MLIFDTNIGGYLITLREVKRLIRCHKPQCAILVVPSVLLPKRLAPILYIDNIQINDTIRAAKTGQILGFINEAS